MTSKDQRQMAVRLDEGEKSLSWRPRQLSTSIEFFFWMASSGFIGENAQFRGGHPSSDWTAVGSAMLAGCSDRLNPPSGRFLSFLSGRRLAIPWARKSGKSAQLPVSWSLPLDPSAESCASISSSTQQMRWPYRAQNAQWHAERAPRRPKLPGSPVNGHLRNMS